MDESWRDQGLTPPPPPKPTVYELVAKARSLDAEVAAVEALWDGDTVGWLVELAVVVRRPGPRHPRFDDVTLTLIRRGGDIRLFTGEVPPWPEAVEAQQTGAAIAKILRTPFHFASPQEPSLDAARWWDGRPTDGG